MFNEARHIGQYGNVLYNNGDGYTLLTHPVHMEVKIIQANRWYAEHCH